MITALELTELFNGRMVSLATDVAGDLYIAEDFIVPRVRALIVVPQNAICKFGIDPELQRFGSDGGTGTVKVIASEVCDWVAASNDTWIAASTVGNSVNFEVMQNVIPNDRIGTIAVAGSAFVITQAGNPNARSIITSVTNSASSKFGGGVAPGEIVTIKGSGLGPEVGILFSFNAATVTVESSLGGSRVVFGGVAAPILYASATQINTIVPYEIAGQARTAMHVEYQGLQSASTTLRVFGADLGAFTANSTGLGQAAAVNQDGSINTAKTPAQIGSVISLFATGEGQTSPPGVDGKPAAKPLPRPTFPVTVTVGGQKAEVQYAGGAPGEVAGLMQVNVQIPAGVSSGNSVPVLLHVGSASSQLGVTIAVP